ncbi:hypothetical protein PIB30_019699 [Stylosanthes scabra]|uniref:Glutathione S-transferase T3-like n=1 Tax=Stylosanthes scabra TaxID=79078 RepID=A0ABU6U7C5_9FABA|nr:hypothetical protein [Stylosanthes scabra]
MGNMSPTCFQFSSQSSASRPDLGGLDAIDLNDDEIRNQRQCSTPLWQWEEDEMLISAWLNISTDPIAGTDQKSDTFWNRINNYCEEHNPAMKRGTIATKKRWYKFSKAVA